MSLLRNEVGDEPEIRHICDRNRVCAALAKTPLSIPNIVRTARRNLLEIIPELATRQPMVSGRTIKRWHMVMDPAGVKRILRERPGSLPEIRPREKHPAARDRREPVHRRGSALALATPRRRACVREPERARTCSDHVRRREKFGGSSGGGLRPADRHACGNGRIDVRSDQQSHIFGRRHDRRRRRPSRHRELHRPDRAGFVSRRYRRAFLDDPAVRPIGADELDSRNEGSGRQGDRSANG